MNRRRKWPLGRKKEYFRLLELAEYVRGRAKIGVGAPILDRDGEIVRRLPTYASLRVADALEAEAKMLGKERGA